MCIRHEWPTVFGPRPWDSGLPWIRPYQPTITPEQLTELMMPTTQYSEVELKFDADHVQIADFVDWVKKHYSTKQHIKVMGRDDYYSQGENVVRHRFPADGPGELTVKCRKDAKSTTNRVEIDLKLAPDATVPDVQRFLFYSGWKPEVSLFKYAEIFHIQMTHTTGYFEVTVVIYDINHIPQAGEVAKGPHRFIEVEVEKSVNITQETAENVLGGWKTRLQEAFKLSEPLDRSLYEIYTKNHYKVLDATND